MNQNLKNSAQALLAMQRMSWEQGVAAQAFFEYGRPDIGMLMVREALRRSDGKGLLGITNPAMDSVDCGANGLPLYYAYQYTGDRAYWAALQRLADWLEFSAPRGASGQLYHNPGSRKMMIDGIYHILPPLAAAGRAGFAAQQAELFHRRHYDSKTGLYRQFGMRTGTAFAAGSFGAAARDGWPGP